MISEKPPRIEGMVVQPLKILSDGRGKIMHMLRRDSPLFTQFGEIYFSLVNQGVVKAWKKHLKMTQHFAVPVGRIRLVLYDDRKHSSTCGMVHAMEMGDDNYCLVKIPPQVCYGFQCISSMPALVANCTDMPHDPEETENRDAFDEHIPYRWDVS